MWEDRRGLQHGKGPTYGWFFAPYWHHTRKFLLGPPWRKSWVRPWWGEPASPALVFWTTKSELSVSVHPGEDRGGVTSQLTPYVLRGTFAGPRPNQPGSHHLCTFPGRVVSASCHWLQVQWLRPIERANLSRLCLSGTVSSCENRNKIVTHFNETGTNVQWNARRLWLQRLIYHSMSPSFPASFLCSILMLFSRNIVWYESMSKPTFSRRYIQLIRIFIMRLKQCS